MSLDVFISYSHQDKLTADAVCGTLEARGVRCWIAPRDVTPGQDWSDAIIDGLTSARVFVLLLSSSSNISEQVKREVQNAVSEGLPIVPFRLEDVALSKHMRYFIGTPHWLDALSPPLEAHLERLAKTILALLQCTEREQTDNVLLLEEGGSEPIESLDAEGEKEAWNPDTLRRIERELAFYIGPMARVIVHQSALKTFNSAALCQMVSHSITKEDERARFLETTTRLFDVPTALPATPSATPYGDKVWDEVILQKIERQFAVHMGPLSRLLVKRASKKARDVNELYILLANNLPTPEEREAFLKEERV